VSERKYLPTFADLVDRLSIVMLKSVFIPQNRKSYLDEIKLIEHDIDELLGWFDASETRAIDAVEIRAIMAVMLTNRFIWENEAKVRSGERDYSMLLVTHTVNGVRNAAKNVLSDRFGQRLDLKVDCLAADLPTDMGNWNLFEDVK
jgi:hypothetical protein